MRYSIPNSHINANDIIQTKQALLVVKNIYVYICIYTFMYIYNNN